MTMYDEHHNVIENCRYLPCPFCGNNEYLIMQESGRVDKQKFKANGKLHKRIDISHQVWCGNCGAAGANSFLLSTNPDMFNSPMLTEEHVHTSQQEALFRWNTRVPISDKAFDLVNKLITEAIKTVENEGAK